MQNDIAQPPTDNKPEKPVQPVMATFNDDALPKESPESTLASEEKQDKAPEDKHDSPQPHTETPQDTPTPSKKSSLPMGIIIFAIIICLGLIGLSVYMAIDESKNISKLEDIKSSSSSSVANPPDVQGAIDTGNKLEDVSDDLGAELSDQSLGL